MRKTLFRILPAVFLVAALLPVGAFAQTPQAGDLAARTADDYRKAARYPAWSKVLPVGAEDPILEKRVPTEITVGKKDAPKLTVWGAQMSYEFPAPVDFYARVADGDVAAITGEIFSRTGELVGTLSFFDDGAKFDKSAADGVFTARAAMLKSLDRPELAENYLVKIQATYADGTSTMATTGFLYSHPWAHLTGKYRDRVVDGNLVIKAQVKVTRAGRFHLAGTLETLKGSPIGTAQTAVELEEGRHWIDLPFFGLMFHDRGVTGPYRLSTLALRTTGGMPNAFNKLVENAHITRAIPLKALAARPFGDPDLLEAAARLETEAGRARFGGLDQ